MDKKNFKLMEFFEKKLVKHNVMNKTLNQLSLYLTKIVLEWVFKIQSA